MPKRVIDFDAMWGSDKLASCAEWAQAEYAWLYGLADASGCFELTNLRVIWGRVAAIRRNLTIERLEQIFDEFQVKGLLFVWEHEGKRYGHWTGSDVPGRLPAPSWRMRLERLAPPLPKRLFAEYVSRFARGRAAHGGGGFRAETERGPAQEQYESSNLKIEIPGRDTSDGCVNGGQRREGSDVLDLKFGIHELTEACVKSAATREPLAEDTLRALQMAGLEDAQAQNWNSDLKLSREKKMCAPEIGEPCGQGAEQRTQKPQKLFLNSSSNAETDLSGQRPVPAPTSENRWARAAATGIATANTSQWRDKSVLVARELAVGQGPSRGPVKVKPEALGEDSGARCGARGFAIAVGRLPKGGAEIGVAGKAYSLDKSQ